MNRILYAAILLCSLVTHAAVAVCTSATPGQHFQLDKNINQLYPGPTGNYVVASNISIAFAGCPPNTVITIVAEAGRTGNSDSSRGFTAYDLGNIGYGANRTIYGSVTLTHNGSSTILTPSGGPLFDAMSDANGNVRETFQVLSANLYVLSIPPDTGLVTSSTTLVQICETDCESYNSKTYIFGDMNTVFPANCTVNADNNYIVTFPSIMKTAITTANAPVSAAKKDVSLSVSCTGVSGALDAQIAGEMTQGSRPAFATSNNDIGILMTDSTGADITPGSSVVPITLSNGNGTLNLSVTPMNITGAVPAVGTYTAVATVNVYVP